MDRDRERRERAESRERERREREPAEEIYAAAVRDFHSFVVQWQKWGDQLEWMPGGRMTPISRVFARVACRNVPGVPRALAEIYEEVHSERRRFLDAVAVLAEEHERELRARVEPQLARVREAIEGDRLNEPNLPPAVDP